MTVSMIPTTAPFDESQHAWLNGFFAGLMSLQAGDATGASSAGATVIEPEEEDFPWHDETLPMEDRLALAEGKPLKRRLMAAMAQLDCGTCGYLCQTYSEAIASGAESNLKLCEPGGRATAKTLKQLIADAGDTLDGADANRVAAEAVTVNGAPAGWSRQNPFPAKLIDSIALNGEGSSKDTRHVIIDLDGSGITYDVGDALGVWPVNCPELVDTIMTELGAKADASVTGIDGQTLSLREALLTQRNLKDLDEDLIEVFIAAATDPTLAANLRTVAEDDDTLGALDLLDLIRDFPGSRPAAQDIVAALTPIGPRLYSIASSLKAYPDQVHLTIGKVTWEKEGRTRKGVASTMFAERLNPGDTVRVFVQKAHGFSVPKDPAKPMLMVGPGTGIAPFRAFLQERQATAASGENWLFFGDQRRATDFLYEHELQALQDAGALHRLDTAFSRDQNEKVYVQNHMLDHGAEIWDWLQRGAHFYICGDASRMACDVDKALKQIVAEHSGNGAAYGESYVKRMLTDGRYQRDVY